MKLNHVVKMVAGHDLQLSSRGTDLEGKQREKARLKEIRSLKCKRAVSSR